MLPLAAWQHKSFYVRSVLIAIDERSRLHSWPSLFSIIGSNDIKKKDLICENKKWVMTVKIHLVSHT